MPADITGWQNDPLQDPKVFGDPEMAAHGVMHGCTMKGVAR